MLACGRKVVMVFLMRPPLQTRYTILSEGCLYPTIPDDNENVFLDSPRLLHAVISLIEALSLWQNVLSFRHAH